MLKKLNTTKIMVQCNQNEHVMKFEIKYYEIFQNDVFMEEKKILKHH